MHFFDLFAVVSILSASVTAIPSPSSHVIHEKRDNVPKAWTKRNRASPTARLPVRIGLSQQNLEKGYDLLMDVSQHDSPNYGKHYTAEEVADMFAPSPATVQTVQRWLHEAGFHADNISLSVNKQWLQFDALTAELESLLNTEYHIYEHSETGKSNIACDQYHVPAHIQQHVDYVTPGIKLFAPPAKKGHSKPIDKRTFGINSGKPLPPTFRQIEEAIELFLAGLTCDTAITPNCIRTMYNFTRSTTAFAGNKMGIFEDLGDVYSQADLSLFFATLAPEIPLGTSPTLNAIDGAVAPNPVYNAGPESDLDFQISYPIIWPQNSVLFQTDDVHYENDYEYAGFFNNFLDAIDGSYCSTVDPLDPPYPDPAANGYKGKLQCGVYKPTNVISISYGGQEAGLPIAYQTRQCNEYMKLGLQGVSIVLSSGDSGVAGPNGDGSANGCLGSGSQAGKIFSPDFPATCPYITTVGATYLPPGAKASADAEVAVTRFPSGGGFSNIFPIPAYQKTAVTNYVQKYPQYKSYSTTNNQNIGADGGIYNSAGRAYPDVSAVGDNVLIFNKGMPGLIGGTSASAPAFGAILTRINEVRLAAGKSTIGFVNPVLYAHPNVLHDITVGSNPGCGTNGFAVEPGWDPVTGLGTPNFPAMLALFMGLK